MLSYKNNIIRIVRDVINETLDNYIVVYRGMDNNHNTNKNVWVSDSEEYAIYWAKKEYNANGVVRKFLLPKNIIQDLCNDITFEEIMNEYDAWQEIPDDSPIWDDGDEDIEYDLMHDLCFPSQEQISILKNEGYKGIIFRYTFDAISILLFNGRCLKTA